MDVSASVAREVHCHNLKGVLNNHEKHAIVYSTTQLKSVEMIGYSYHRTIVTVTESL